MSGPVPPPGNPPFGPAAGYGQPPLVSIGDIQCTQSHVVTPIGSCPIQGARWHVTDMTQTTEEIPTWAIVCAIVGAFVVCLFSLFFLLVKERRVVGTVSVMVQNDGFSYTTAIPANGVGVAMDITNRVNYARMLSTPPA
ncbi:hypothetical protein [Gordonia shandongensis]|uniref:hypothetical protein n=1 Tax=Gordonia shandongensis TaxID=376351 RepID=UPI00047EC702|nr:hypothetical protein [Gordonia shandongensis]